LKGTKNKDILLFESCIFRLRKRRTAMKGLRGNMENVARERTLIVTVDIGLTGNVVKSGDILPI
jgi:hypothetical protein